VPRKLITSKVDGSIHAERGDLSDEKYEIGKSCHLAFFVARAPDTATKFFYL
jgi:hypothetical protein